VGIGYITGSTRAQSITAKTYIEWLPKPDPEEVAVIEQVDQEDSSAYAFSAIVGITSALISGIAA